MNEWRELVAAYRRNRVSFAHVTRVKRDPPLPIGENRLGHEIPIDDDLLAHVARDVASRPLSRRRIGREWMSTNSTAVTRRSHDDMWVAREDLRDLDAICTKFTTKRFFPDAHTRINMVINMIRLYDRAAKVARQRYFIVFKGGVMMRLQLLEFLHDLDVEVRYEAIRYLSDEQHAVGVSDFDFEIVPIDHEQPEGETWRQTLTNTVYLLWVRRYLERYAYERRASSASERSVLIDTEWDYAEAEYELLEMLRARAKEFPSDHPLHGCTIDYVHIRHPDRTPPTFDHRTRYGRPYPSERENLVIFKCTDHGRGETCVAPTREVLRTMGCDARYVDELTATRGGCMYVTTNYHIGEHEPRAHRHSMGTNFHLSRIKHAFVLYYTTRTGERRVDRLSGEIIDLSQSHGGPFDEARAHLHAEVPDPYRVYRIPNTNDIIRSYTIDALLHEVQDVLHHSDVVPWDNEKVQKRLVRYAFLLVLQVLRDTGNIAKKIRALTTLTSYLARPNVVAVRKMPSSGFAVIDTFAAHEHMSASTHGISPTARRYYRTLHDHLQKGIAIVAHNERTRHNGMRWHLTPLNAMHVEHDDLIA